MFNFILIRYHLEGEIVRRIPVEPPKQEEESEYSALQDLTSYEVCGKCDREERIIFL
jgi:hypothetical protein